MGSNPREKNVFSAPPAESPITAEFDYREFLREVFRRRKARNPRFSMRAFARELGFSPSFLSRLLGGQKRLSDGSLSEVCERLRLSMARRRWMELSLRLERADRPSEREAIEARMRLVPVHDSPLEVDPVRMKELADWIYLILLEAPNVSDDGEFDCDEIAARLGVESERVGSVARTLGKIGLLSHRAGRFSRVSRRIVIRQEQSDYFFKSLHAQVTHQALRSLERDGPNRRYSASEALPMAPERMPELRRLTDAYLDAVHALSKSSDARRSGIYLVSLHAFPALLPENA